MSLRSSRSLPRHVAFGAVFLVAVVAAACGGDDGESGNTTASTGSVATTDASGTARFPVTVETFHGPITIAEAPSRVVVLDAAYADAVAALGASPAAVSFAGSGLEDLPWLDGVVDPAVIDPTLSTNDGVNFEAVAALHPDVIIGAWWLIDEAAYSQLSAIAPTIAGRSNSNDGWEARLEVTAEALGLTDRVAAVKADVGAGYAELAAQVPQLAGRTYNYTGFGDDIGFFFGNGTWLEPLGVVPNDNQDNSQQAAPLSFEQMDQIDGDVWAIWPTSEEMRATIETDGRFARQAAVEHGIVIWLDRPLANATNAAGPLSLQWTVQELTPVVVAQAGQLDG